MRKGGGTLVSLIALHRWQLHEQRRALAELEGLASDLDRDLAGIDQEVAREEEAFRSGHAPGFAFHDFAAAMRRRRQRLEGTRAQIGREMEAAQRRIGEAYQEVKRYELAQAERERREEARFKRLETAAYDEIGGVRAHRQRRGR